ncbi:MAG: DNA (cytosine-5-)-methyltransferase, partial [Parcubacteria group bacterium]|nr:DNA (cytosine-5-)-methyltransferase [Parcubacteria group bacterium]
MIKYISLFSGIAGFELGIQQAYEDNRLQQRQDGEENNPSHQKGTSSEHSTPKFWEWEQHRPICIGFSEIDKYATQIYEKHFPTHTPLGDIYSIEWEKVSNIDLIVGGFPCQSFSIAGKRKGFEDTRGTLFFEIAKGLKIKQPNFVLLENVKGLISHDKGKTLEVILETLQELGYYVN